MQSKRKGWLMPRYKCGQVGPVPLADGRVVTHEESFDLDGEIAEHDQALIDNGTIVLEDEPIAPKEQKSAKPAQTAPADPKGA
jgi:hypothetical protein